MTAQPTCDVGYLTVSICSTKRPAAVLGMGVTAGATGAFGNSRMPNAAATTLITRSADSGAHLRHRGLSPRPVTEK
jgi:hypothetical protein